MNIALLNVYDIRNRGDLAITLCQMEWLRLKYPRAKFNLFSRYFESNAHYFGPQSVQSVIGARPKAGPAVQFLEMSADYWNISVRRSRNASKRLCAFYDADLYSLTGGGYLYSSRFPVLSRNLINICQTFLLAGKTGKPVIQFPQSYGPFSKGLDVAYVKQVCQRLPRLLPRSKVSKQILDDWGFGDKSEVVPDVVFLMRKLLPDFFSAPMERRGLGMAPVECAFAISMTSREREEYLEKMAKTAEFFYQTTGEPVMLFSQVQLEGGDDDSPAVRDLHEKLRQKGVPACEVARTANLQEYLHEFQKLRMFVGSRMHSCIFAFVTHTPVIGLAYQPKFQGSFDAMERPEWVKPIQSWSVQWATDWIGEVLTKEKEISDSLRIRLESLAAQIEVGLERALFASVNSACPVATGRDFRLLTSALVANYLCVFSGISA